MKNTAADTKRDLIYLPVESDIKQSVQKISSLTNKSEGQIYLEVLGIAQIDTEKVKANISRLKLEAMADFMGVDKADLIALQNAKAKTDNAGSETDSKKEKGKDGK